MDVRFKIRVKQEIDIEQVEMNPNETKIETVEEAST